jgi:rhodanese-related sulfurtransferase
VNSTSTATTTSGQTTFASVLPTTGLPYKDVERVQCVDLKAMIDAKTPVTVVDNRSSDLFIAGHIPGAVNIPDDPTNTGLESALKKLPKDHLIVTYCD